MITSPGCATSSESSPPGVRPTSRSQATNSSEPMRPRESPSRAAPPVVAAWSAGRHRTMTTSLGVLRAPPEQRPRPPQLEDPRGPHRRDHQLDRDDQPPAPRPTRPQPHDPDRVRNSPDPSHGHRSMTTRTTCQPKSGQTRDLPVVLGYRRARRSPRARLVSGVRGRSRRWR
jgi:hypothetical protein